MSDSSGSLFDIVFRGDILPGHQLMEVKQRLGQLFKADENKINALFTGAAVPLKRNLEKTVAEKYVKALNQAGAEVQLMAAGALTARTQNRKAPQPRRPVAETPATPSAAATSSAAIKPAKTMTLAERLAAQEREAAAAAPAPQEVQQDSSGLTLAPVGSDVLKPEERQVVEAVEVDTSALNLRETGGNLLDASEQTEVVPVAVDIDGLSLGAVGEDLLDASDRRVEETLDLDLSGFDLAEPGADMGQIKPDAPPPAPDTSNIHLQD